MNTKPIKPEEIWKMTDEQGVSMREKFVEPLAVHVRELMKGSDMEVDVEEPMMKFVEALLSSQTRQYREEVEKMKTIIKPIKKDKMTCQECGGPLADCSYLCGGYCEQNDLLTQVQKEVLKEEE